MIWLWNSLAKSYPGMYVWRRVWLSCYSKNRGIFMWCHQIKLLYLVAVCPNVDNFCVTFKLLYSCNILHTNIAIITFNNCYSTAAEGELKCEQCFQMNWGSIVDVSLLLLLVFCRHCLHVTKDGVLWQSWGRYSFPHHFPCW